MAAGAPELAGTALWPSASSISLTWLYARRDGSEMRWHPGVDNANVDNTLRLAANSWQSGQDTLYGLGGPSLSPGRKFPAMHMRSS